MNYQYNSNGKVPAWGVYLDKQTNLVVFHSSELKLKKSVTTQEWAKCVEDLKINQYSEVEVYERLKDICDYFIKKDSSKQNT